MEILKRIAEDASLEAETCAMAERLHHVMQWNDACHECMQDRYARGDFGRQFSVLPQARAEVREVA